MGVDLRALIGAVLSDPDERRDFIGGAVVLVFGLVVLYALVFLAAGAVAP